MKRKILFILIAALTVLTTFFSVVAYAYDYDVVYEDTKNNENYDPNAPEFKNNNLLKWDTQSIADIPKSSGAFYIANGASVNKLKKNLLNFDLFCSDSEYIDRASKGEKLVYELYLIRQGTDTEYYESVAYQITWDGLRQKMTITNLFELKQYQSSRFSPILSLFDEDGAPKDFKFKQVTQEESEHNGWTKGDWHMRINFEVPSVYTEYRFLFRFAQIGTYTKKVWDFWPFKSHQEVFYDDENPKMQAFIASDVRSYYYVLNAINQADSLDEEFQDEEMRTYVSNVLGGEEQKINVEYLENISDGIPFAHKVKTTATVKIIRGATEIPIDDVCRSLDIPGVNALLSPAKNFVKGADGTYTAYYYPSVYLEAKTVDGNVEQYILDPNKSYEDFFMQLVNDEIINNATYEYLFATRVLQAYPQLAGMQESEIFGYWGYAVIPNTFSVNQAVSELFNTQLKFDGIVKAFDFEQPLSLGAYNKLLKDYNYGWLERIWNDVWGTLTVCNAKHVCLFADCTTSDAYASMNGEGFGNTSGLAGNTVTGAIEDVGAAVEIIITNPNVQRSIGLSSVIAIIIGAIILVFYLDYKGVYRRK